MASATIPPKEDQEAKPRLRRMVLLLDADDYDDVTAAVTLRRSGLFRVGGELVAPDGDSNLDGAMVAEICRSWIEHMTPAVIDAARNRSANR